jgi:L-ribulokinase
MCWAIFAFLAAGTFKTVEEAQDKICAPNKIFEPARSEGPIYTGLYGIYSKLYFALGQPAGSFGGVLPKLIQLSESGRQ